MSKQDLIVKIHNYLKQGLKVRPKNALNYEFVREPVLTNNKYQNEHFATQDGYTLALRCSSNWFGSLVHESDIPHSLAHLEIK